VASALITIVDPAEFAVRAAGIIAAAVREAAARAATISLALSGGRTPQPVHAALADQPDMPWARVRVYFADERAVPPDDPDSNYGMARQSLLSRVPMAPDAVFRMEAERPDRAAAARDYAALLPDVLDVLVLGLGEDGHTCSLFPHSAEVRERVRRVVPARGPNPPRHRLTITPPVIARARMIVMLVAGGSKADAVAAALEGADSTVRCPGQLARSGTWVIDTPASARLAKPPG
jgi:6-phosphogluconolactonase